MPVVKTLKQKKEDGYRKRIREVVKGRIAAEGIKQKTIAQHMGLTPAAISKAITGGTLSLIQLLELDSLLHFSSDDMERLFKRRLTENL